MRYRYSIKMTDSPRNRIDRPPAVLCCNTLEDELGLVLAEVGPDYEVVWLEAGYHNRPAKFRDQINEILGGLGETERVILALGHCGGAVRDLDPRPFELIVPRADDCLSLLLGSLDARQRASKQAATYFLTAGWLRHTENLITSFHRDAEHFGRERAEMVYRIMLKHYRRFGFIDTGAYRLEDQNGRVRPLTDLLDIKVERLPGDLSWLRRLLTGPWDEERFIIVPPGGRLTEAEWNWPGGVVPQLI